MEYNKNVLMSFVGNEQNLIRYIEEVKNDIYDTKDKLKKERLKEWLIFCEDVLIEFKKGVKK